MAYKIVETFNKDTRLTREAAVLNFVNGRLIENARERFINPAIDAVDVEEVYNAILLLTEREILEISAFVET
jgi:hypothetical protein